jgi:acyl carrier protein
MKNNKVVTIISEQLKLDLNDQSSYHLSLSELGADSLDVIELVIKLEDAFKQVIGDEIVAQQFNTVADIINYFS